MTIPVIFELRAQGGAQLKRAFGETRQALEAIQRLAGGSGGLAAATEREERAATDATLRGVARRKRARQEGAREATRAEREADAIVKARANGLVSAEETALRARIRLALQYKSERVRIAKEETEALAREERRRSTFGQRAREAGSAAVRGAGGLALRGGLAAAGAAANAAPAIHDAIQGARQSRASTERELGLALYQAGANRGEVRTRMARLSEFARAEGIDAGELARAANASQTEFSTLAGPTEGDRGAAFENFLRTARFARDTGNDLSATTRLQGFFTQQQLGAPMTDQLMRFAAGAAQNGSVEMGDAIEQALGAITSRIATAQAQAGGTLSLEARRQITADTFRQTFSELQVEASAGMTARSGGNAMARASQALAGSNVQSKVLNNIANSRDLTDTQRTQLREALFERGGDGRQRLRSTNVVDVMSSFQRVMGNNSLLFSNIFAGGGHGNAQSLLSNQRGALGNLLNADASGRSGLDRLRALQESTLSDADIARGRDIFANDTQADLTRNEESRLSALTQNTGVVGELSNRVASLSAQFPMLTAAVAANGGALGMLRGAAGGGVGLAGQAVTGAVGLVAPGTAATLAGSAGAAGLGATAAGVGAAALVGLGIGRLLEPVVERATRRDTTEDGTRITYGEGQGNESIFSADTWRSFGSAVADAFRSNPPTVVVTPQAVAHAAGQRAGSEGPPPESRGRP